MKERRRKRRRKIDKLSYFETKGRILKTQEKIRRERKKEEREKEKKIEKEQTRNKLNLKRERG